MTTSASIKGNSAEHLRKKLKNGGVGSGIIISMPSVQVTQVLSRAGFDWLFIDMEHGPIDIASVHAMIAATAGSNAAPFVRVPWNVHWLAKPVLDAGAMGIVFPMVKTAAEAAEAVASVRYPPVGERGHGPFYAPLRWGVEASSYADAADSGVFCMLLIEHKDALADLENIVKVPGVDACLIAPYDLAMSFGYRDGPEHPEVQEAIAKAQKVILNSPVMLGGLFMTEAAIREAKKQGCQLILTGFDVMLLQQGAERALAGFSDPD